MPASPNSTAPRIYNLFPRLAGDMRRWPAHAARARAMGFDWLYLNPVHYPGFSGSCYAVKDFWRIDPQLLPEGHADKHYDERQRQDGGMELLRETLQKIRATGIRPMMDLVLNHTSKDSALVTDHPEWYVRNNHGEVQSPSAIDPADARKVTVWGDLAEIDNATSPNRDGLWEHWIHLVGAYTQLGFEGFRCDAAYKVPSALWPHLITAARSRNPHALFFGETLGAKLDEVQALHDSGLPFVFNSSKYWDFEKPWCLEQQHANSQFVRSVSFPESHDTTRLWADSHGNPLVQRQRYAFAAAFASGVLMPVGYEYGFEHRIHVVETKATDWEPPHTDLSGFITRVNTACQNNPHLVSEHVRPCVPLGQPVLLLQKRDGNQVAHVALNKDLHHPNRLALPEEARGQAVLRVCRDTPTPDETSDAHLDLAPAEVVYLV